MIKPALQDQSLLADVRAAPDDPQAIHLWWLGQSGFLLKYRGQLALLDPYLSDSLTLKYQQTDKPHVRMSERVIDPGLLDRVCLVTSSHNHTDHLDADTLVPLIRASGPGITLVAPEANRQFVLDRLTAGAQLTAGDFRFAGIDDNVSAVIGPFEVTGVPAAHETIDRDESGRHRTLGFVVCCGRITFYHSGDTMLYDGIVEKLRPFATDIALLPINGRAPERRVAGNLNGGEAASLAWQIGAKLAVPHHYDMFAFNTADPAADFIPECQRLDQPFRVLKLGERLTYTRS